MKKITIIVFIASLLGSTSSNLFADGVKTFISKCGACHALKVDGKNVIPGSIGADLTGVANKYSEEFIKLYMTNPAKARKKFPGTCKKLLKKCGESGMTMPAILLRENQVNDIYEILK